MQNAKSKTVQGEMTTSLGGPDVLHTKEYSEYLLSAWLGTEVLGSDCSAAHLVAGVSGGAWPELPVLLELISGNRKAGGALGGSTAALHCLPSTQASCSGPRETKEKAGAQVSQYT